MNISIIGGDVRQGYLAEMLNEKYNVTAYALDRFIFPTVKNIINYPLEIKTADVVILPMPLLANDTDINASLASSRHKLQTILQYIPKNSLVLAGSVDSNAYSIASKLDIQLTDYLKRDELKIYNAIATAEGAIQIAMEEMPITLHGSKCLIIGNGNIGSYLRDKLIALGAYVTVSARSFKDFAQISLAGAKTAETYNLHNLSSFDLIINTVPSLVLGENQLCDISDNAVLIDLASRPGGVDFEKTASKKVIWALSLPGKVAPITSAKYIADTVNNILKEEGIYE